MAKYTGFDITLVLFFRFLVIFLLHALMPISNRSINIMKNPRVTKKTMAIIPLVVLNESATAYLTFYVVFFKLKR